MLSFACHIELGSMLPPLYETRVSRLVILLFLLGVGMVELIAYCVMMWTAIIAAFNTRTRLRLWFCGCSVLIFFYHFQSIIDNVNIVRPILDCLAQIAFLPERLLNDLIEASTFAKCSLNMRIFLIFHHLLRFRPSAECRFYPLSKIVILAPKRALFILKTLLFCLPREIRYALTDIR